MSTASASAIRRRRAEQAADFEAYQAWEQERRRRDEVTDAAERISAPLSRTQEFFVGPEGLVTDLDESLREVIVGGVEDARWRAGEDPDWAVELLRREIDLEEYDVIEQLAAAGEGALVSFWMIPDAVRNGNSRLPGYNRARQKMFVRIAVATDRGVAIRYRSLDGSDRDGVAAMDNLLGNQFDHRRTSEEVARDRRHLAGPDWDIDDLDHLLRSAYDGALSKKLGGEWFAGRPAAEIQEAISFISRQGDLISRHMDIINKIFAVTEDPYERNRLAEPHRFNFAAALDDRLHGRRVGGGSLQEAGDGARAENRSYDGDCPPAGSSAASQLRSVGFRGPFETTGKVRGSCPTCHKTVYYDPCDPACSACGATAKDPRPRKRQALGHPALTGQATRPMTPDHRSRRPGVHRGPDGRRLHLRRRIVVGGTQKEVVDADTGQVLADNW